MTIKPVRVDTENGKKYCSAQRGIDGRKESKVDEESKKGGEYYTEHRVVKAKRTDST